MLLWIAATLLAFYLKGLCGFANTLVFNSIMNFGDSAVNISPVELLLGFPTNIIMAWRGRRKLRAKLFVPPSVMTLLGSAAGAFLLRNIDASFAKIFFGALVVSLGVEMLLRERGVKKSKGSPVAFAIVGVLSGVLSGLFGVGALLAAYMSRTTDSSDEFKANMCAVFFVGDAFRLILYAALGIITPAVLRQTLILSPFMLVGLFLGIKSCGLIDERRVRRLVVILLIISGAALIVGNL
ncbi:MAG: sulfite exporter TauE/SafE family protein [Clostridia bacterium]|nr:sulfite exporter TauE/SafE family protein [Clostridia bacterium]